jgi:23S rRNA U2552 (ribose-2'-O)-methylase RlmE/FtsJ
MAPIEGVIQVQGDITNARTAEVVRMVFNLKFSIMFILCGRVMVFVASSE